MVEKFAPTKALIATGLTFVVTFVSVWIADSDPFTGKEAAAAAITALVASGVVGVPTYAAKNKRL
jgi:phage terminase large subunit-like protein